MKKVLLILSFISLWFSSLKAQVGLKDAYADYFTVGVAVNVTNVTVPRQASLIKRNFNSITAEDDMKPGFCHPSENTWDFSKADSIADFCRRNGIKMRGHVLMWNKQFSTWMYYDANGQPVTKEKFYERLRNHIHTIMNRYKDVVYAWDVVNEVVADDDQTDLETCPYRKSEAYLLCGEEYITKAFEFAYEVDPNAVLIFNDYNTCNPGKRDRMYKIVKKLVDAGVPVSGIGMQGHYNVNSPSESELDKTISLFSTLVKHIHISEFDLSCNKSSGATVSLAEKQKQERVFAAYFKVFRNHKDVIDNVTFWNLYDRESWIGSYNYPLLWDENLNEKDAYYTIRDFQSSTSSDPLIAARLAYRNAKNMVKDYANYFETEGFVMLAQTLRDYIDNYTPSGEIADAYNKAAADMKSEVVSVQVIADQYYDILNDQRNLLMFADKTKYPGFSALTSSLGTVIPREANVKDLTTLSTVTRQMRNLKKEYLFSQMQPTDGSGIIVTKMLTNPWFCDEVAEPVSVEHGAANYYVDWARCYTTSEGWIISSSDNDQIVSSESYAQGRTALQNRYKSDMPNGWVDACQQITDLKPGLYTVSADFVSEVDMTDAYVYAQSSNSLYARSQSLSTKGWDGKGYDQGFWETLTTGKVYIGQGDTLIVGIKSEGNQKKGSYCVTNFQLSFYDSDVTEEINALVSEIQAQIDLMKLTGDIRLANERLKSVIDSDIDNANKLNTLLLLSNDITKWVKAENEFLDCKDYLEQVASTLEDTQLKNITVNLNSLMSEKCSSEDITYKELPTMLETCSAMILYIDVASYATYWNDSKIKEVFDSQCSEISKSYDTQLMTQYSEEIRQAMRSTISSYPASEESPLDVTFLIKNPSFSSGSGLYWQGTSPKVESRTAAFSGERNIEIFQILRSVPNGKYRLEANAFYRDGSESDAYGRYPKKTVKNSRIYLNYSEAYLSPWASGSSIKKYSEADCSFNGIFYYPSSATSADYYFRDGYYLNSVESTVTDSCLLVGISKYANIENDWTVCDNFSLYYLGDGDSQSDNVHYVTVGEKGNVSYPFWQTFSDYFTVKDGMTGHFQFMNYSDMANTWDNWILAITSRPDHNTGVFQDYEEFIMLRPDNYGWGTRFNTAVVTNDFNFDTFKQDMNGALVDMYITYKDGEVNMNSTTTTNAENPDASTHKTYHYSLAGANGIWGDQIYVYFSVEKANLQGINPIITDIEDLTIFNHEPQNEIDTLNVKYNLSGQIVDDSYKGIVIVNGKKHLMR